MSRSQTRYFSGLLFFLTAIFLFHLGPAGCNSATDNETTTFSVGGTVSGLSGTLVLQNNGGNDLTISADGQFVFTTKLSNGAAYSVTVSTQPSGQTCTVTNGSGTIAAADVANVAVECQDQTSSACSSVIAPDWDHPWPMFHGFENHQGRGDAAGPQSAGTVQTFNGNPNDVAGSPPNSIAIRQDGTIFLAGGDQVYSIEPTALATNWFIPAYPGAQGPALSQDGNALYFGWTVNGASPGEGMGFISAVNTADGVELLGGTWTFETNGNSDNDGQVHFGPTVGPDGTIYQGSWDHFLYAIDPATKTTRWTYETQGAISYPPSILNCADSDIGQLVILGGGDAHNNGQDCYVYALRADTGELVWAFNTQTETSTTNPGGSPCDQSTPPFRVGTPAISDDGLIYAPASPTLFVLDANGNLQWQLGTATEGGFGIISPAIAGDGTIYMANSPGGGSTPKIYAIDPSTHEVKAGWPFTAGAAGVGIPTFPAVDSEGTVYFGTDAGHVFAVDKDGNQIFDYTMGGEASEAAPALANGRLYISSDNGNLYVIGP